MSKDEIITLKEEFLKEIRALEKKLNMQLTLRLKELDEKNDKFIQEFKQISTNNKSLTDLIATKNLESHKINEFEIFKKKTETTIVSHEVRLNSVKKDLDNINYTHSKELYEKLAVPGFIGPSCKFKNLAQYIAMSTGDMDKMKNENESNKKETREIKRKMEDMIKTLLNLVDKSNEKSIEYINNKMKILEESINNKFVEIHDKIVSFKAVLLTQDKTEEFKKNLLEEINENNYNKKEIDNLMNNILKNSEINFDSIKSEFKHNMNKVIKSKMETVENEIKEINKVLKETKIQFLKSNQFQSKLFKELWNMKNIVNKNNFNKKESEENNTLDFNWNINKNLFGPSRSTNRSKTYFSKNYKVEEEKTGKNKVIQSFEKNITLESFSVTRKKSSKKVFIKDMKKTFKEEDNKKNKLTEQNKIDKYQQKDYKLNKSKKENINDEQLNVLNSDSDMPKDKEENIIANIEDNKLNISKNNKNKNNNLYNSINEENNVQNEITNDNKKDIIKKEKKVKYNIDQININENEKKLNENTLTSTKNKKEKEMSIDNNTIIITKPQSNSFLKKEGQKNVGKNKKLDFINIISYGMNNNDKITIIPLEQKESNKDDTNSILQIFKETNSSIKTNNNLNKTLKNNGGGYSLHKLAEIGFEEDIGDFFPTLYHSGKIRAKTECLVKPFRHKNSPLYQSYDSKLDNYSNNMNNINNKKITSAFGRTSYSIYNKKEEGIKNLINKRIKSNENKRYKFKTGDLNMQLSPVAKIKIYEK